MTLKRPIAVLFLLIILVVVVSLTVAQSSEERNAFVVEDFRVEDVPHDDGTGLVLSWKPLDRQSRIIEYRIYRGISSDTLFYHASIPVNVKTGVAAEKMFYYDTSWNTLVETKSPTRLRRERKQAQSSPLYRAIPRDPDIIAGLVPHFSLLSLIPNKGDYYHLTRKSFSADVSDSIVYAGISLRRSNILAQLKPQGEYYYTVVAVDERSYYHEMAPITKGKPLPNPPEPAQSLYAAFIEDKDTIQFEWQYPLFSLDLHTCKILMLPAMEDSIWVARRKQPGYGGLNPMVLAHEGVLSAGSDTPKNYKIVDLKKFYAQGFAPEQFKNARFALELGDHQGLRSFTSLIEPTIANSAMLPGKLTYRVEDKPNDKGDRLVVIWDYPMVFLTKTSSLDDEFRRLRVNYQLNAPESQRVSNIYFKFFEVGNDKPFQVINEFYTDNAITVNTPVGYDHMKGFLVRMTLKGTPMISPGYSVEQDLVWDTDMRTFMPGKSLRVNGVDVSQINTAVYRKRLNGDFFSLVKSIPSYDSSFEVSVPYKAAIYRLISGISITRGDSVYTYTGDKVFARTRTKDDPAGAMMMIPSTLDLTFDRDAARTIQTSLFPDEAKKMVDEALAKLRTELAEQKETLSNLFFQNPQVAANAQDRSNTPEDQAITATEKKIENTQKLIRMYEENNYLKEANGIGSRWRRIRFISRIRERDRRLMAYHVVRTNGKGLFTEAEHNRDADGKYLYEIPVSNWFDRNKFTTLVAAIIFGLIVIYFLTLAKRGRTLYIRPIAGLFEIDNAIGRATEMGRPILYCMGIGGVQDVSILASFGVLSAVARKAAEYDTRLIVPCYDFIVTPIAQEVVKEAHYSAGRPDSFDPHNVFYLTNSQFPYVAGVNGIQVRERVATNFFMGFFAAESLLMTETGNHIGAIQIAGSDAATQIPFFITTCDYTLIGEEYYAASTYLSTNPMMLGTLKGQDYYKFLIISFLIIGTILATFQITQVTNLFPSR